MKGFPPNHLFLNKAVKSITNHSSGRVLLHLQNGRTDTYDHVILATHSDQALEIISASATPSETSILSALRTSKNTAILHSDLSLMPRSRKTWTSWNYMTLSSPASTSVTPARSGNIDQVCLTYNMNILQHIPASVFGDVLVTLNPLHLPPPEKVQCRYSYLHPLYAAAAIRSQNILYQIQNTRGISYWALGPSTAFMKMVSLRG
jgi:predicted NAD/FAD-binding protein